MTVISGVLLEMLSGGGYRYEIAVVVELQALQLHYVI